MVISVTEFKARCTQVLRELSERGKAIQIANRGRVITIVEAAPKKGGDSPAWGALRGSVRYLVDDFDAPPGDCDWEAAQ